MGIFIGSVERWSNDFTSVKLAINCDRRLFAGLGNDLSAHETYHILATADARNDIQLWRFIGMVRNTRHNQSIRLPTIVYCWHFMDHCLRHNLRSSGTLTLISILLPFDTHAYDCKCQVIKFLQVNERTIFECTFRIKLMT